MKLVCVFDFPDIKDVDGVKASGVIEDMGDLLRSWGNYVGAKSAWVEECLGDIPESAPAEV